MKPILAPLMAGCLFAGAAQAEEVTLRAVTAFATGTTFSRPYEAFVDWVNENGKGQVQIEAIGGPETVPPFEVGNALSSGVVDIVNSTGAFYSNLMPAADALKLAGNTIQDQRENGCYEEIDRMHQEALNAKYLGRTGDGIAFHLYLTDPIEGPEDVSGLMIRTTPVYQAFFQSLGATPMTTPPGEVYTALERGTIDGYGWPIQGVLDLGWEEQTGYRVDPGFYQVDVNILVNRDRWESLTDEQRAILEEGMQVIEARNADNLTINEEEAAKQTEAGIETITFSEEDAQTWNEEAQKAGWDAVASVAPEAAETLRTCLN